ncbi:MAG: hypothetical protein E5V60_03140 [Mesorhizobium sp.]|nr:MAG: hypothetical protein E5V60_03140 [Mesorhizobium sp.]
MARIIDNLTIVWRWLLGGLPGDVRSSAVGAVCATLVTSVSTAYCTAQPVEFTAFLSEEGYAKPLPPLVALLKEKEPATSVTFDPADLEGVFVCEFAHVSAPTAKEVLFSYLDRYSMCLSVTQTQEAAYVVKPNRNSGQIYQKGDDWLCKCN